MVATDIRRRGIAMESIKEFIARNRKQLLRYLDGKAPSTHIDPGPLQFVDNVVSEWIGLFGGRHIQAPTPRERTFWAALYLFEEMQEVPPGSMSDPYVNMMKGNLEKMGELLRNNEELPGQFFATRPGEDPTGRNWDDDDWDDDDWDDDEPGAEGKSNH